MVVGKRGDLRKEFWEMESGWGGGMWDCRGVVKPTRNGGPGRRKAEMVLA
jgi:hypothetical protein